MFLLFALLAFALFAPVVLLPMVKEHCELLAEEARLAQINAELEKEVARQKSLIRAFEEDATINERLAVLDLHYNNPTEETVTVLPPDFAIMPSETVAQPQFQSVLKIPATWPEQVLQAERWANRHGLIDLFMDGSLRPVFLLMAGGLIIAAFVLFAPRVQPETARIVIAADGAGQTAGSSPHPA